MPVWYYLARPTHYAFHNLTNHTHLDSVKSLLGLSLKFTPTPSRPTSWKYIEKTCWPRLERSIHLQTYFGTLDSDDPDGNDDYNPKMYIASDFKPPTDPRLALRIATLKARLRKLFTSQRRAYSNLLPHQEYILDQLKQRHDLLVVQCDKNLGPALITRKQYIALAFRDHLSDSDTYHYVAPSYRIFHINRIKILIQQFIDYFGKVLNSKERKFLRRSLQNNNTPLAVFYTTMKIHKTPMKTRPIVSCSGSLLYPLGLWVNSILQKIAIKQRSYFKSSLELKDSLLSLEIPPGARLFTADAVSMYTNIPTSDALRLIERYLQDNATLFPDIPIEALLSGLEIVMYNNLFDFGDTCWHQVSGTAMGTPPAPPYATLYYAIHEDEFLQDPVFADRLFFYRRFIDDVIGIFITDNDASRHIPPWLQLQSTMNSFPGLVWEFSELENTVNYMDLTISLTPYGVSTTLYEKPQNLHLYLPPHSCHPKGVISGLVLGGTYRIFSLCSDPTDVEQKCRSLYHKLLARGWKRNQLLPLFHRAIQRCQTRFRDIPTPTTPAQPQDTASRPTIAHFPYNPADPDSSAIQRAWRSTILDPDRPSLGPPIRQIKKRYGTIPIDRLIVAYHRPPNLGNLLSYRKLATQDVDCTPSTFLPTDGSRIDADGSTWSAIRPIRRRLRRRTALPAGTVLRHQSDIRRYFSSQR